MPWRFLSPKILYLCFYKENLSLLKQGPYVRQIQPSLLAVKYDITLSRATHSLYVFIVFFFYYLYFVTYIVCSTKINLTMSSYFYLFKIQHILFLRKRSISKVDDYYYKKIYKR